MHTPVFIGGHPVTPLGDSLFAVPVPQLHAVLVLDRHGRPVDTVGAAVLTSPGEVQVLGDSWYVADVDSAGPSVAVFSADGTFRRRQRLTGIATVPEQFAALPGGGIVVDGSDQRLVLVRGDSVATFATTEISQRPNLMAGAGGGVVHGVPDKWITSFNGFGNVRWRIQWPWRSSAYVTGFAVDDRGRIHVLAGVSADNTFIVYSINAATGEIVRWSAPESTATFVVDRLGAVSAGDTTVWRVQ